MVYASEQKVHIQVKLYISHLRCPRVNCNCFYRLDHQLPIGTVTLQEFMVTEAVPEHACSICVTLVSRRDTSWWLRW